MSRKDTRICFVGDSLVNGTGDPDCLGWAGRLCARARQAGHDVTYYNLGIRRDTSADIAARWLDEVSARLPEGIDGRVVFAFGVNDTVLEDGAMRVTTGATLDNARAMLGACRGRWPLLWIGPTPLLDDAHNLRIKVLSRHFAGLAAELDVPYLEVFDALRGLPAWTAELRAGDGAHPGADGYAALAELVAQWPTWRAWTA
ncbi:MAG TPA: GDSL-type esterase/lipase family protein [Acidiferrobacterales bacterium]